MEGPKSYGWEALVAILVALWGLACVIHGFILRIAARYRARMNRE
ncbi:MAG: hypothetical protein AAGJ81_16245 [Verrucomicrobiota bacterium]